MHRKSYCFIIAVLLLLTMSGCGFKIRVVQDDYSLDNIEGDITCEYRVGKDAEWSETRVDTDVVFDKEMFLKLFHEENKYDVFDRKKHLKECELKITSNEEWQRINESEFNVKAVFAAGSRSVSIYRYDGKLYFFFLDIGSGDSKNEGAYYMELSEEMRSYWQTIIDAVEADIISSPQS